jgi:hypothetical protein
MGTEKEKMLAGELCDPLEAIQPTESDTLVFLGDYIDRGPDSRGIVEQVITLAALHRRPPPGQCRGVAEVSDEVCYRSRGTALRG